jgi:hypothetical protein
VGSSENPQRGYWLIHPTGDWNPNCLAANKNNAVVSQSFDRKNTATKQRWLILSAEDLQAFEQAAVSQMKADVTNTLVPLKALADVPHTCSNDEADQTFADAISLIEQAVEKATTPDELTPLADEAWQAAQTFLSAATPTNLGQPFDLTFLIKNAGMDAADGWSQAPTINYSCGEFYEKAFTMRQQLTMMPLGTYRLMMQGFQRPGGSEDSYSDWTADNNKVNAVLIAGNNTKKIAHIADCAQTRKLGGTEVMVGGKYYVPNNMQAASIYFAKGFYDNYIFVTATAASFYVGLRSLAMPSKYWCIFDNFRLHYFGSLTEEQILSDVSDISRDATTDNVYYDLQGRRITQPSKGLYIINGKKSVVR